MHSQSHIIDYTSYFSFELITYVQICVLLESAASRVSYFRVNFPEVLVVKFGSKIKWNPAVKTSNDREKLWDALNNDLISLKPVL